MTPHAADVLEGDARRERLRLLSLSAPATLHQCFFIFIAGMVFTFVYSAPAWGRTKANAFLANLTIAIPRGCLLKVAGWSMVASVFHVEPWYIGSIFFLFLVGAASTKDFSDMRGDEAARCRTLPIRFGVSRAARMIAPFFVLGHFLVLGTGLALLLSAFIRNRTRLEEEELARIERATRIDLLYQETPALLVVLGADRLVAAVSNDWLRFTGYTREEVMAATRSASSRPA